MSEQLETAWAIYSHAFAFLAIVAVAATRKEKRNFSTVGKIVLHLSFFGMIYYWTGVFA